MTTRGFWLPKTNGMMNTTMRYHTKEANIGMQLTVYYSLQPIQSMFTSHFVGWWIGELCSRYTSHKGPQAQCEHLRIMYAHWDMQIPQLACTYLQWKHNDKYHNTNLSMEECHIFHVTTVRTFGMSHSCTYGIHWIKIQSVRLVFQYTSVLRSLPMWHF